MCGTETFLANRPAKWPRLATDQRRCQSSGIARRKDKLVGTSDASTLAHQQVICEPIIYDNAVKGADTVQISGNSLTILRYLDVHPFILHGSTSALVL